MFWRSFLDFLHHAIIINLYNYKNNQCNNNNNYYYIHGLSNMQIYRNALRENSIAIFSP